MFGRSSDHAGAREEMVAQHLIQRGITDPNVLAAMRSVPREEFVGSRFEKHAYDDRPLPIEERQTISQPFMVALMAQAAELDPDCRVLEIGTGSGYGAAVLSRIAAHVWTIERHQALSTTAQRRLSELGYNNITVVQGDGSRGLADHGPFDAIVVTAAASTVPAELKEQLTNGGRLIIPVGTMHEVQQLMRYRRHGDGFEEEELGLVRFVELVTSGL